MNRQLSRLPGARRHADITDTLRPRTEWSMGQHPWGILEFGSRIKCNLL